MSGTCKERKQDVDPNVADARRAMWILYQSIEVSLYDDAEQYLASQGHIDIHLGMKVLQGREQRSYHMTGDPALLQYTAWALEQGVETAIGCNSLHKMNAAQIFKGRIKLNDMWMA